MMFRRLALIVSLITVFGLGQQGAAVHAISHFADEQSEQHKNAPPHACEKCEIYAQLGSAVGVAHALLLLNGEHQKALLESGVYRASEHTSYYASRAPPSFTKT